ncbi:hypothetical protein LSAT2_025925 [Lamellibrachia satsuma]|nr:hypothetical protein LSAT2_025925 [Lamellibrachia satsuma]
MRPFFLHIIDTQRDFASVYVPYIDINGLGAILTLLQPVFLNNTLLGVAGFDVRVSKFWGDKKTDINKYMFIISKLDEQTLFHPMLPSPVDANDEPFTIPISKLERDAHRKGLISKMTRCANVHRLTPKELSSLLLWEGDLLHCQNFAFSFFNK